MNSEKPYGYKLEFFFNDNEFFKNKVLTKSYDLTMELNKNDKDPLSYEGPVVYRCHGCKIEWATDKDVTVKQVKKKQKHKATGTFRVVSKEERTDSFFNFFSTPTEDGLRPSYRHYMSPELEKNEEIDDEEEMMCEADFELGHFFKEFMIPKAVLYFTGELVDEGQDYGDDEYDDMNEDDDEGEDDDEDDDDESDEDDAAIKKSKSSKKGGKKAGGKSGEPTPTECKNQ
jgi:nucleosome assembly protein 1-like 1